MDDDEALDSSSNPEESKVKSKPKREQQAKLEQIVNEMKDIDSNILLSEMNKIIAELKQVQIEKQSLESKTMLDNINQQNDAFSKLLDKSGDESAAADSSMLSKI